MFFCDEMMRPPTKQEIMNNLTSSELDITREDIEYFMRKNKKLFDKVKPKQLIEKSLGDIEMGNPDNVIQDSDEESDNEQNNNATNVVQNSVLMSHIENDAPLNHL